MYLLGLSIVYIAAYFVLFFGIPLFFGTARPEIKGRSIVSIAIIFVFYFVVLFVSGLISDPGLANRVIHTFGGGFLIVVTFFLAAKDCETSIGVFQFIVLGMSLAALFGVANEVAEYVLQNHLGFVFADSVNDTWLDLISNTIGMSLATACLAPFVMKRA
jgi:hypothetical protein